MTNRFFSFMFVKINGFSEKKLMKKGKSVKLNLYSPIKTSYGTVDAKNLKSLFVNIQSWVCPKIEQDNWSRVVSSLRREIILILNETINSEIFMEHIIVDLDLRASGIMMDKRSFFNLEITLYTNEPIEFRNNEIKESVKKIVRNLYRYCIIQNKYFDFSSTKKELIDKV